MRKRTAIAGSLLFLFAALWGVLPPTAAAGASAQETPAELVRSAVANEVAANNDDSIKHMFRDRKQTPHGSQTRLYVETREALAGMTIANDDKPLTPDQLRDEEGRLASLVDNPEQLHHKARQQKDDAERTLRIVKALPDAFFYENDGEETGTASVGHEGCRLLRLKFHPDPAYRPPSHVEDVLVGMSGVILIDTDEKRIAKIDGTLFREVSFGWGILGHLDKGGHFLVEQEDVGDNSWEISRMKLEFSGKIVLFKSISINAEEVFSHFKRVPSNTTFAEGVQMLKAEEKNLSRDEAETANMNAKPR
jgi:hypothetical protein